MDGAGLPSAAAPPARSLVRLGVLLWPFATAAVAVNLFLLGLIVRSAGGGSLSPLAALVWAVPLGLPATWAAALWLRSLLRAAEG